MFPWWQQLAPAIQDEAVSKQECVLEARTGFRYGLRAALTTRLTELGRTAPQPIDLEVLLNIFEFVGFRSVLADPDPGPDGDAGMAWGRATMARMALAMLGPSGGA